MTSLTASRSDQLKGNFRDNQSRLRLASTGSLVAWFAAVCWVALGVESIVRPEQENYRDIVWMLPFALTAVTFLFIHATQRAAQRSESGRLERVAFYLAMTASALAILGNVGLLTDYALLATLSFPWGALLWAGALIMFGVSTWKAKALPRYVGLALILLEPGSILTGLALSPIAPLHDRGAYTAGVEKGMALAVLAIGLRTRSRASYQGSE